MLLDRFNQAWSTGDSMEMKKLRRSIMTKMIDMWNVNKLTVSWIKMELGKLQTKVV